MLFALCCSYSVSTHFAIVAISWRTAGVTMFARRRRSVIVM